MRGSIVIIVPGHALHEKGLQRQIGVGTLVSSQGGRRPGDKPLFGRRSNACFVPPSVYIGFRLFVLPRVPSGHCLRCPGGNRDGCFLGGPIRRRPVLPCPTLPRPSAVRRPVPTRPWYVRVLGQTTFE